MFIYIESIGNILRSVAEFIVNEGYVRFLRGAAQALI